METRDWIDGLFSNIFREMNKAAESNEGNEKHYVCFDGDVDALWIENMNSVMDDNKLLTLANGERIRLSSNCALIFEVGNLAYASPATVSRAGMVFVDPKNLGYAPYWQRWVKSRPEREWKFMNNLYEKTVPELMAFVHEGIDGTQSTEPLMTIVMQTELNMVVQLCMLLNAILPHSENDKIVYENEVIECCFIQSLYFSFGATLVDDSRIRFDVFMKKINPLMTVSDTEEKPANFTQYPSAKSTLYEYFFNLEQKEWIAWEWMVPQHIHNSQQKFNDILVPTDDTLRTDWVLSLMNQVSK
jgi:dynein heavy chain, axonemal